MTRIIRTLSLLTLASSLALSACGSGTRTVTRGVAPSASGVAPSASGITTAALRTLDRGLATGSTSGSAAFVIDDELDWATLWEEHQQGQVTAVPRPQVDFNLERVLAVFGNPRDFSVEITQVSPAAAGLLRVDYVVDPGTTATTRPFHFVALSDTSSLIRFQQTSVAGGLEITPPGELVLGVLGPYTEKRVTAVGGTRPYRWELIAGSLPSGVRLVSDADDAVFAGTASQAGSYTVSLQVTDQGGRTASSSVTLTAAPLQLLTVAGGLAPFRFVGDGLPAIQAGFVRINKLRVGLAGEVYVSDEGSARVRVLNFGLGGVNRTVAGNGTQAVVLNDGGLATAAPVRPYDTALDAGGHLYVADRGSARVRRVDAVTGLIETVAGTGESPASLEVNFRRDGFAATTARLWPTALAFDLAGNLLIGDSLDNRIRKVDATTGIITTFAGGGPASATNGDGGPASLASMDRPASLTVDPQGNVYVTHGRANLSSVRKIDYLTGVITTVAGSGPSGLSGEGDGGLATAAKLNLPQDVRLDRAGNMFIREAGRIRRVDVSTGIITTVAGTGAVGLGGDGGLATAAALSVGRTLAIHPSGAILIGTTGYPNGSREVLVRVLTPTPTSPFQ